MTNKLFYGDNLAVLRESIGDDTVDLVYLDPPFNSNAGYNVLFKAPAGQKSEAQIEAFEDTWHWTDSAARAYEDVIRSRHTEAATMLKAMRSSLGENDMMAYLAMMAVRLVELHRVLKPTGSLYLHCDPTASHYLKTLLDSIFGYNNFKNEIVWRRSQTRSSISKIFRRAHDNLLFYSKGNDYLFNLQYRELSDASKGIYIKSDEKGIYRLVPLLVSGRRNGVTGKPWRGVDPNTRGKNGMHWVTTHSKLEVYDTNGLVVWPGKEGGAPNLKFYLEDNLGVPVSDFWNDIPVISPNSPESLGYPTQKPLALLERVINASSRLGDVVLDPFCGCGTAVHAAQKLERQWIGIDITHLAVSLIERRLKDSFPGIKFEVDGTPKDLDGARDLALRDKYQFEWWAVSLVDAVPQGGKKKGMDRGIDGIRWVRASPKEGDFEKVLVSVKGGENVGSAMVRDLKGTVEREGALGGMFITLTEPTREMTREAAAAGFFETSFGQHPKIQILTVAALLAGQKPNLPSPAAGEGFKKAQRESSIGRQIKLI